MNLKNVFTDLKREIVDVASYRDLRPFIIVMVICGLLAIRCLYLIFKLPIGG